MEASLILGRSKKGLTFVRHGVEAKTEGTVFRPSGAAGYEGAAAASRTGHACCRLTGGSWRPPTGVFTDRGETA